jgi:uncharacterized protein RhaS with RHS repeats
VGHLWPNSAGSSGPATVTRDAGGVITAMTDPNGTVDTITRDGSGRIATYRENGVTRTIARNVNGRITGVS